MARSLKKGPFVESYLLEKIDKMNASGVKKPIKTWSRRSMVTPDFVGHTFLVHNGKTFIPFLSPRIWWPQARRIFADTRV
jgi:Ribosomal protein S19